jgi:Legume lectin domain
MPFQPKDCEGLAFLWRLTVGVACGASVACWQEDRLLGTISSPGSRPVEDAKPDGAICIDPTSYPGGGLYEADIASQSDMVLNAGASSVAGALRIARVGGPTSGSAFFAAPIAFDPRTSIFAHFTSRMGGGDGESGADGMVFVLQSSPRGATAVGDGGEKLGYAGGDRIEFEAIVPSVGVEFDTAQNLGDPDANHVALLANGDVTNHLAYATPSFQLNDGVARNVWIEYAATSHLLEVYMADGPTHPSTPLLRSSSLDFSTILGNDVYVGFTAATGGNLNDHDLVGEAWIVPSVLSKCMQPPL